MRWRCQGGPIIVTDALVELAGDDEAMMIGVLGHELGHVRHRDGLRMLIQTGALSIVAGLVIGDFSGLLAGVPVLLGQSSYSRDAERAADAEAVAVLKAAGLSPLAMVRFFEAVRDHEEKQRQKRQAERAVVSATQDAASAPARSDRRPAVDDGASLGISIASHPADAERIAYFQQAAALP
jgi:Zn-dependent protease with chaperone function